MTTEPSCIKRGSTKVVARALAIGAMVALATGALRSASAGQALSVLTVPASALPEGCALTPVPTPVPAPAPRGGAIIVDSRMRPQFPSNPWTGTDRQTVAAIHAAIDAMPAQVRVRPLPDVPPAAWRSATTDDLKWADNIVEAYHAAYTAVDGSQVKLFAVTFNDVKLATAPESVSGALNGALNPPAGLTTRLVRGATAIRISASTSPTCFGAVRAHIESLK